ncbi:MAG: response regulator [Sulfuricella sp.]|nr:response regulator [Sulfuricella sp.]
MAFPTMNAIAGFGNLALIHESSHSRIYRGEAEEDGAKVIVKELRPEAYTFAEEARYRREYEILRHLHEVEGVPRARALQHNRNSLLIVLGDGGGDSLYQILRKRSLPLFEQLRIAVRITEILGAVHSAGVIHRDVNPSNIIFNPESDAIELIDYGISTLLSVENPVMGGPSGLEGTLAYISPEQTGRTNRAVDYRSDYYSLGVTLYELFAGILPFASGDSMETVHAHLALRPTPLHEAKRGIPAQLSAIIGKLLAKNAEDRYQSTRGIRADLEECLRQLREGENISEFPLGREDVAERFIIPDKLYGRDNEIKVLMDAFLRAAGGGRALLLVGGYSGVGKSCLVREVYWPIARQRGFFISGKFDQFKKNIPYSAVVNAFQGLIRQLLTGTEKQLGEWRDKLRSALGANGRIITEVIPEVELIVGPQAEPLPLAAVESENRFRRTLLAFIQLFLAPEHPLVLFLDDLQWADSASLRLIELLMGDEDIHHLFIIGAYRDNETGPDHPLSLTIEKLEKTSEDIERIALFPLGRRHVRMLLADTLHRTENAVRPLSDLVVGKTGGNPFFVNQFLMTLNQERLISFSSGDDENGEKRVCWHWDLKAIEHLDFTDNVVDLMIGKLQRLPEQTQQALRLAACVGNSFDLHTLAIIHEKADVATYEDLLPAVRLGFILTDAELAFSSGDGTDQRPVSRRCRFLHDRVQQAAYALIDDGLKQAVHLRIGRLLAAQLSEEESLEHVFELADHFNKGAPLLDGDEERIKVGMLNLAAVRKAKASTAYDSALRFLREAETVLCGPTEGISLPEGLLLRLYRERAELEYLNGNYQESERYFGLALGNAATDIEIAEVFDLQIVQYTMLGRHDEAIATGRLALERLGITMPFANLKQAIVDELASVHEALGGRRIDTLIDAPTMSDPRMAAAMRLLNDLTPGAYFDQPELYSWILAKMTNLSLRHGHVPESGKGYTSFGNVLAYETEAFREGYEFGMLGLHLSQRDGHKTYVCRCCFVLTSFLVHWVKPIEEGRVLGEQGYQAGLDSGELLYAGYILAFNNVLNAFFSGHNLLDLLGEIKRRLPFVEKTNNRLALDIMGAVGPAANVLVGGGREDGLDENAPGSLTVNGVRHVLSAYLHFLFDRPREALVAARAAAAQSSFLNGTIAQSNQCFYLALILAACDREFSPSEREEGRKELVVCRERLKHWAVSAPHNFAHQHLLVCAEQARLEGRRDSALALYDEAIEAARNSAFIHDEALANELAGRFLLIEGKHSFARLYLREALDAYQMWGAQHKVESLKARYPALLLGTPRRYETLRRTTNLSRRTTAHDELDLNAVLKASQAISGEIVLERLLNKLMEIVMESAGAEKGSLILKKGDRLEVEVDAAAGCEMTYPSTPLEEADNIAGAIVNYVAHTREDQVLDDASREALFAQDEYVRRKALKSVLCIPILHHRQLIGLLYLENNQSTAAFTAGRVALLKTIASQAAISLENARFYTTLEESEHKFRSLYENAVEGIFRTSVAGRLLTANPAMARILGYDSPADLLATVTDIATQIYADPERRGEIIRLMQEKDSVSDFETRFKRKGGSETWVSISARVVHDETGGIRYIDGSLLDINERKEKERAERERKEADIANQAKSAFLSSMSHEIRTPMNAILGLTELTLATDLTPKQRDYLRKVKTASHTLLGIINDILDVSKIEAGKMDLEVIDFDLEEVLSGVSDMIGMSATRKGIELLFDIAPQTPTRLLGDPLRLGQILLNLSNNAVKFTDAGEILVTVGCREPSEGRVKLNFCVRDTGIGMSEEQMGRIFQSFSQADSSTTRKYGGTGLGLTISKKLVEMMGGEIAVQSETGKGSMFSFTAVFGVGAPAANLAELVPQNRQHGVLRVLVVDDSDTARLILEHTLRSFGFDVTSVDSGIAALRELAAAPLRRAYDLVLMDWKMPGMDGIEATRRIRENDHLAVMPAILMISAYSREEVMRQAWEAGVDEFLAKPFYPTLLLDSIRNIFERGGIRDERLAPVNGNADEIRLDGAVILLVDDQELNLLVAKSFLEKTGATVVTAGNGRQAVERIKAPGAHYDAVLMDIQMPVMDGYEACQTVRRDERFAGLPIIAMTAHATAEERKRCLDNGMNDHLSKPVDPVKLFAVLREWIAPKSSGASESRQESRHGIQLDAAIADLPGLRLDDILTHLGYDEQLLYQMAEMFLRSHTDAAVRLRAFVAAGNLDEARRIAHTLKGTCGQMGALPLSGAAQRLEDAIMKNAGLDLLPLMNDFEVCLTELVGSLRKLEAHLAINNADLAAIEAGKTLEPAQLAERCRELAILIEDDVASAIDLIATIGNASDDATVSSLLLRIRDALQDFDAEVAQEHLRGLMRRLEYLTQ